MYGSLGLLIGRVVDDGDTDHECVTDSTLLQKRSGHWEYTDCRSEVAESRQNIVEAGDFSMP